jgi:hypothetical protein
VSGNEWEIAGYPPCGRSGCGHPDDEHGEVIAGDDGSTFATACLVDDCDCEEYMPYPDGPDPDELYDRMVEQRMDD